MLLNWSLQDIQEGEGALGALEDADNEAGHGGNFCFPTGQLFY